jgi:phosphoribosylglycinamide formyltransferase-1
LIYNTPEAKAAARAANWTVPAVLLNHRDFQHREDFDRQIVQTLRQYEVEWVVMAGWMRLVTPVLIDAPDRIINIHPSLLPSFRGVRAVEQALDTGVKITGCTVHLVCLEVDSGPILLQAAVPVLPEDTKKRFMLGFKFRNIEFYRPRSLLLPFELERRNPVKCPIVG